MKKGFLRVISLFSCLVVGGGLASASLVSCGETQQEVTKYKVSYEANDGYVVTGLKEEYEENDAVSFQVEVKASRKVLGTVTSSDVTIEFKDGNYTFLMPKNNVAIVITLQDESSVLEGKGTEKEPFLISNPSQFLALHELCETGNLSTGSTYFSLEKDIDLGGESIVPIGSITAPFGGVFEGNNHTISNFKIVTVDDKVLGYGLFGVVFNGYFTNLNLSDVTIDLELSGSQTSFWVGGLTGACINTYIENVDVSFTKFALSSLQNTQSQLIVGGIVGSFEGTLVEQSLMYLDILKSSVSGDIKVDMSKSADSYSYVGGIVGNLASGPSNGIMAISNCFYNGNLVGGSYVGGIAGRIGSFGSIVDSYAIGESIEGTDKDGAVVGGIVGFTSQNSAVLNVYSGFSKISAALSTGSWDSYAGPIYGYASTSDYDLGVNTPGATLYNPLSKKGATITGDSTYTVKEVDYSINLFKEDLGFTDKVWDFTKEYPLLKDNVDFFKAEVVLDSNGGTTQDQTVEIDGLSYNPQLSQAVDVKLTRENFSFYGYCYDEEGTTPYCWYAPISDSSSLYAGWESTTEFKGNYHYKCEYGGNVMSEGSWKFDDQYFYWVNMDYQLFKYEYYYDGVYVFIGDAVTTSSEEFNGQYYDSVFKYENHQLVGYDINQDSAIYTGTKSSTEIEIPSYSNAKYLGKYYSKNSILTLYEDGNALSTNLEGKSTITGGYRYSGGTLNIEVMSRNSGTYIWNDAYNCFGSNKDLFVREEVVTQYNSSEENGIVIVKTKNKTYLSVKGKVSTDKYDGVLTEGSSLTIDGNTYKVVGQTLEKQGGTTPDPDPDPEPTTSFVGTWKGKMGPNSLTLVLKKDGTGLYNDINFTYTNSNNVLTCAVEGGAFELNITYDPIKKTLEVSYDDGDWASTTTLTDFTASI